MNQTHQKAWICKFCGYIHYGDTPPAECPVCGENASQFELMPDKEAKSGSKETAKTRPTVVIVGAGIAGVSAAEEIRKTSDLTNIILLSNEKDIPYYRISLTRYLAGMVEPEQFALHPQSWYETNNIDLRLGVEAISLNPDQKNITLDNGMVLGFDQLLLTTGARPFVPPIPGTQLREVYSLRTRHDADQLLKKCPGKNVVLIGGGLLGLETASALMRQGAQVTVLETMDWLIPRQLNRKAATIFQDFVERLGITVRTSIKVQELRGDGQVRAVALVNGNEIPADLVIFSAGVRSNITLATQAGLQVNQGIVVDKTMHTSHPDIFAAGDNTEHEGILYGTWNPAQMQGKIAGNSAGGNSAIFTPLPRSTVLKVLGIDLFSTGKIQPDTDDLLIEVSSKDKYTGFIFQKGVLVGAILLGDATASTETKKAVESRLDCSALLEKNPDTLQVLAYITSSMKSQQ